MTVDEHGRRLRVPGAAWQLAPGRWENWTLRVAEPGNSYSTLLFFDECETFLSWYVDFEEPLRRTPIGFDTLDWKLDLVVLPNGTTRLKDEDELAEAHRAGMVDEAAVRALVDEVLARPPWPIGWEERPPPATLPPATLPAGWDAA